ncbi:MAG: DEAD/DEAH box helicase [Methanomethylophilus alvi]|nr:MAG: DEAD/DEAH box helicase [Methanomethylophilus alvi]
MTEGKFEDLGISDEVLRAVRSVGWEVPTPVQSAAIPAEMKGDDILALAQTGTGKTGAYGAAILSKTEPNGKDPSALVLVPTRELATQVSDQLNALSKFSGHRCIPVYGGVNIENQVKELSKGSDVIIATPGRLKDLLERKTLSLNSVRIVVLDEADRMLDMGFAPSVNMILSKVPRERQTLMFSATMNEEVKKLVVKHMINHKEIEVSPDEPTVDLTAQYFIRTTRDSKREELARLIDEGSKIMVFCRTKRKVDYLSRKLKRDEYVVGAIHGDMPQNKREKTLRAFEDGDLRVLIASDVAARGFDVPDVDLVVNFDIPAEVETYIHRIGRTGRAGRNGRAITFVNSDDEEMLAKIEKAIGRNIVEIKPTSKLYYEAPESPKEDRAPKKKAKAEKRRVSALKAAAEAAIKAAQESGDPDMKATGRTLKGQLDRGRKSRSASAEASAPSGRQKGAKGSRAGKPQEGRQQTQQRPQNGKSQMPRPQGVPAHPKVLHKYVKIDRAAPPEKDMSFDRLEISVGSDDGIDQDKLLEFVLKTAGIRREDVGNIHVYGSKSRVQVVRWRSQEVVDELFGHTVNGRRVMVSNLSDKQ